MNVHLCVFGGELWLEHLLFRDYLRSHPETVREYEGLKRQTLAELDPDPPAYNAAKERFIREVIARATGERVRVCRVPCDACGPAVARRA